MDERRLTTSNRKLRNSKQNTPKIILGIPRRGYKKKKRNYELTRKTFKLEPDQDVSNSFAKHFIKGKNQTTVYTDVLGYNSRR